MVIDIISTPVEEHWGIFVKREDLCVNSLDAPPFSKMRGVYEHLLKLKESGVEIVGYTETSISMAGWGIAYVGKRIGLKVVIFDPIYETEQPVLDLHRTHWKKEDALIYPIKAGMAKVNYYISKKKLSEIALELNVKDPRKAVLLPLGVPFTESVSSTFTEAIKTLKTQINAKEKNLTIVVCVGSGTIAAGVAAAAHIYNIPTIGILCREGNIKKKKKSMESKGFFSLSSYYFGLSTEILPNLELIDMGWKYTKAASAECPFPCHPYYDLKAWEWLMYYKETIPGDILFWNIGSLPKIKGGVIWSL